MKHLILATDDGPSGQRCARLYGTTAASVHDDLLTSTFTDAPASRWHLVPRLQHSDVLAYEQALQHRSMLAQGEDESGGSANNAFSQSPRAHPRRPEGRHG